MRQGYHKTSLFCFSPCVFLFASLSLSLQNQDWQTDKMRQDYHKTRLSCFSLSVFLFASLSLSFALSFRQLLHAILSTALSLSVFQVAMMLVLLGLAFSRPVTALPSLKPCEGFGEVACAGDLSNAWVNSNLTGPSLPPAGTIIHHVCAHKIEFLMVFKDRGAYLHYKTLDTTKISISWCPLLNCPFDVFSRPLFRNLQLGWCHLPVII